MQVTITIDCDGDEFADNTPGGISRYLTRINHDVLYNVGLAAALSRGSVLTRDYRDDSGKVVATFKSAE